MLPGKNGEGFGAPALRVCVYIYRLERGKTLCSWTVVDTICQEAPAGRWNEMKHQSLDSGLPPFFFPLCSVVQAAVVDFSAGESLCLSTGHRELDIKGEPQPHSQCETDHWGWTDGQTGSTYSSPYLCIDLHRNDIRLVHQKKKNSPQGQLLSTGL